MATDKRLAIARRIAAAFEPTDDVRACCVSGSVALGAADEDSDLDLAFICAPSVPAPDDRLQRYVELADSHGDAGTDVLGEGTFDFLAVEGVRVEPEFHVLAALEGRITQAEVSLGTEREPPFGHFPYGILSTVHYWGPLFDKDGVVARLKARTALPDPLRRAILRQGRFLDDPHLIYEHERACARGDAVHALRCQSAILDHFVQMLFALNRTHYPGDKFLLPMVRTFGRPGGDFCERLEQFLALPNDAPGLIEKSHLVKALFQILQDAVKEELASG